MRTSLRLLVGLVLASCGGGSTSKPAATATTPPPAARAEATVAADPVPGAEMLAVRRDASPTHCGGQRVTVEKIADGEPPSGVAELFLMRFPDGLYFGDADPARREQSQRRFQEFLATFTTTLQAGLATHLAAYNGGATPEEKVAAVARRIQLLRRGADLIALAEIPADVRTSEFAEDATAAYCDTMREQSMPLLGQADDEAGKCRDLIQEHGVHGWWDAVCAELR